MTNSEIFETALIQSATDLGCRPEDFLNSKNITVPSSFDPAARKYLELPFLCNLVSYGNNIVASVSPELMEITEEYINKFPAEHCFETPALHIFMDKLRPLGLDVCFMAEYFLPDTEKLHIHTCCYETRILCKEEFAPLYTAEWSNALCEKRRQLDMMAVGAYDVEKLIGLAGASADCESMWQIGIDVLPEYRRQGIAAALTSRLAAEIIKRGKVPFYCCAWSNVKSAGNAIKCGFKPAWAELTVKSKEYIKELNRK